MTADLRDPAYWDTAILRSAGRLFMLAALADRPGHGYDIARRLSGLCGDWCKPSDAMIYPAIRDLEAAGLISCELDEESARRRRVTPRVPTTSAPCDPNSARHRTPAGIGPETSCRHCPGPQLRTRASS